MDKDSLSQRGQVLVWIGLLLLLTVTCGSTFIPMGKFNFILNMIVSVAKTLLIMFFFMNLWYQKGLPRIIAFSGFIWLSVLIGFTLTEYLTRAEYLLR